MLPTNFCRSSSPWIQCRSCHRYPIVGHWSLRDRKRWIHSFPFCLRCRSLPWVVVPLFSSLAEISSCFACPLLPGPTPNPCWRRQLSIALCLKPWECFDEKNGEKFVKLKYLLTFAAQYGTSSVGRALVSKTRCREFEPLVPCIEGIRKYAFFYFLQQEVPLIPCYCRNYSYFCIHIK